MERFSPLSLVWAEVIVKHDWACSNLARRRGPRTATKITHNNLLIILQLLGTT